jgi:hypothetical protein
MENEFKQYNITKVNFLQENDFDNDKIHELSEETKYFLSLNTDYDGNENNVSFYDKLSKILPDGYDITICYYYQNNQCSRGDSCMFRHDFDKKSIPPVCQNFNTMKGCKFGKNCLYLHYSEEKGLITSPSYLVTVPNESVKNYKKKAKKSKKKEKVKPKKICQICLAEFEDSCQKCSSVFNVLEEEDDEDDD